MPSRIIREGINSSPRINALSPLAELFYRRLMSVADDYGRYYAAPATLRGACWPTCPEKVKEAQILEWLKECSAGDQPLIVTYYSGNCGYLQITDFNQQTRGKSKFPDCLSIAKQPLSTCEADAKQMLSTCEAFAQPSRSRISESKSDAVEAPQAASTPDSQTEEAPVKVKRATLFSLTEMPDEWASFAQQKRGWNKAQAQEVFESFSYHWNGKAGKDATKRNWYATWCGWVIRQHDHTAKNNRPERKLLPVSPPTQTPLGFRPDCLICLDTGYSDVSSEPPTRCICRSAAA